MMSSWPDCEILIICSSTVSEENSGSLIFVDLWVRSSIDLFLGLELHLVNELSFSGWIFLWDFDKDMCLLWGWFLH